MGRLNGTRMSYGRYILRGGALLLLVGLLSAVVGDIGPARPGLAFNPGAPTANAGGPYTADEGAQVTFSGDAADAEDASSALTYEWDFEFSGSFTVAKSGVNLTAPTHTYTDDGSFTVALRVRDTDADVSAISTAAVTILNVPPSVNAGGPYTVDEGTALVFNGSATDPGEDTLTYEWDFGYDGVSFSVSSSGEDLTGPSNTYTNDGARTAALRVRDEDGGVSAIETAVVTVSNVPPTASLGISFTGNEGSAVTFSGSATDPGNDTLTYEWDFTYNGRSSTSISPETASALPSSPTPTTGRIQWGSG